MAFALKGTGSASTANSTTANQASLVVTTATTAGAAGDLAILIYAVDNNATTDIDEVAVTGVTDSGGNQWRKAVEFTNGQGTAQTGATNGIWFSNLRAAIATGGTVTLTFSNATSRDATAASLTYFTKATGYNAEIVGVPSTLANDAAAAGSLNVTTPNIACLRVRGIASESNVVTALTPTATFAIVTQAVAVIAAATSMGVRGEWVINTGTGTASAPTAGAGAVDNASVYAAFAEVPIIDWNRPLSEPVMTDKVKRAVSTALAGALFSPVIQPPPVPTNWFSPLSQPVMRARVAKATVSPWTAAIPISDFDWYLPLSEPVRRTASVARIADDGLFATPFTPPAVVVPDMDWLTPLSTPVPTKRGLHPSLHDVSADVYPETKVVTVDEWFNGLSIPNRAKQRAIADYAFAPLAISEVVTIDKWFNPLADPASKVRAPNKVIVSSYTAVAAAEIISVDKWFEALSEPVRAKQRFRFSDQSYVPFVTTETVTVDKWFDALSEPARIKRFNVALQRTLATEYFPDTPNAIAGQWYGSFSDPVRVKSRFAALQVAFTSEYYPDTFTQWFSPLSEPTRVERSLNATSQSWVPFVATAEVVTVDKWFESLSEPVRRARAHKVIIGSYTAVAAAEIVTLDKWFEALSEPTRIRRRPNVQDQAWVPLVTAEVVTVDKWLSALSEPVRVKRGLNAALQVAYTTEYYPDTFTQWLIPLSEPARTKRSLNALDQSWVPFVTTETVTVDKWFDQLSEPARTKSALRAALQPATAYDAKLFPDPANFLEGWSSRLAEPVRQKLGLNTALQSAYTSGYFSFEIITVDKWFDALSEPKRSKPALQASLQTIGSPSFEVVTVDKWYASLSDPKRFKPALHVSLQQTATQDTVFIPSPSQYQGWYGAFSEPQRQQAGLKAAQQVPYFNSYVNVAVEIITVDKWFVSLSNPTQRDPGDRDRYNAENEFTAIAANMKWFAPLTQPVLQKRGLAVANQTAFFAYPALIATEIITVDKWFKSFADPVRPEHPADDRYAGENNWEAVAASMEWFAPFTEPVRFKPGLVPATRPPFFASPAVIIIPSLASWWRPLAEPPKAKVSLGTHLQRAFTQDPKLFPDPSRFLEGWFNWFSEPVRKLRQLNAALQQAYSAPDRRPVLATITVTLAATETNNDVALFAIKVFAGNPPATAVVSLVEIGHGASLTSIVEEGDDGSGTSIVES